MCVFITLLVVLSVQSLSAQNYSSIDKSALQIPESSTHSTAELGTYFKSHFSTEDEKARAIFVWVASSVDYDVENMFAINFYENRDEKIQKVLQTHKGICEHYASLFTEVCQKAGLESYVVEGYTKQHGYTDFIPHAWSAAKIDTSWFLFDPTWGAGYVKDNAFYHKFNAAHFKVAPAEFIKTHMPFDYLWQFLNYTISNQEFAEGKFKPDASKAFFEYKDSIASYNALDSLSQFQLSAYRVERNGMKNAMVFDRLQHLKMEIENQKQQKMAQTYNSALEDYNTGIASYNNYIAYKNKQFTPKKPDAEIQSMVDVAGDKLKSAIDKLATIKDPGATNVIIIDQLKKSINDAAAQVKEQKDWLKEYFSKGKVGRNSMFYVRINPLTGAPMK